MKKDNKWLLGGLIGFTGILLATAIVLFIQLKQPSQPLPTPQPKPVASPQVPPIKQVEPEAVCELSFTVVTSPSPSPSPSVSPSPSPSPQLTACFDKCSSSNDCEDSLSCLTVGGDKRCVNPNCSEDTNCVCPGTQKACFDKCENSNDCADNRTCLTIPGTNDKRCVNSACVTESDCACNASPTPITYNPPASVPPAQTKGGQPVLPQAGVSGPAILGVSAGLLLIIGALLF